MAITSIQAQNVESAIIRGRKCQYLGPWAINEKTKDTLTSQTYKADENCSRYFLDADANAGTKSTPSN